METITPQEIRANLILKGITQVSIARKLGVAPSMISMVVHGTEKNKRVRKAIARAIEKPVSTVFRREI